tara:strand:+ start:279 stop:2894 length:2616 start_codon:yes stop_codon:yes gene_type:complete
MATIRKNSKINFYKFVQVQVPNVSAKTKMELKPIISNTVAINNLGATVNSIAVIVNDFKKIQLEKLVLSRKSLKDFEANYTKTQKKKSFAGFSPAALVKKPSWLEGLFKMLSGLIKAAIVIPALKWLSDPKNRDKVARMIEALSKLATFIFKVAEFGVVNTIEGLYTLLSDQSSPWEKIGGLVRGLTGLGTLLLGMRWLSNPTRIITDFGNVLIFLHNNLIRGRRGLLGRAGALGLLAGVAYGGYKLYTHLNEDGSGGKPDPNDKEGKSQGGKVKILPSFAQGGWISGPQSGYGVSLDGGRSTSFIGHGTEYVARKADGGAFVVPFNTPATKTQPNLTQKRLGEAKSQGFSLPGFDRGGTLPKLKKLSPKSAFDHIFGLAKDAGGAKYPELVAASAMNETGYLNPRKKKSVYVGTNRTNAFGQIGDRGFGTIDRKGHNEGWSKYNNLFSAVKDNISLWHDTGKHSNNFNAFGNVLDGIASIAPSFSPDADPEKIKKGFFNDKWSKGMVRALKVGGFDINNLKDQSFESSNSGSGQRKSGNIFSNFMGGVKSFFGFGAQTDKSNKKTKTQNKVKAIKPASHPDTGSGFTVAGTRDQSGRPLVFSQPAAQMFAAAMRDSGIDLGSYVASSGRSKSKNDEIGGDPNSHHLYGEALDINGKGYQWLKANGKRFGWQYVYNHNPDSAHFKYVGAKSGTTPILSEAGKEYAGGNSLEGHIGEGSREGSHGDGAKKKQEELSPKVKKMAEMFGKSSSSAGMRIGGGRGASGSAPASQFQQTRQQKKLEQQTKSRNDARRQVTERSQEMIKEVMAAVAQQNGVNSQAIQAAQQALAQVASASSGGGQPQMISSGGGGSNSGSIASILQSTLNPLRGLLR